MPDWYYEASGSRKGPISDAEMDTLIKSSAISDHTLCWCSEFGTDWKPVDQTTLLAASVLPGAPPPLPRGRINNFFAFAFALVPLIGSIIEQVIKDNAAKPIPYAVSLGAYQLAYIILAKLDCKAIARSGYERASAHLNFAWALLAPVYLWKRATYLRHGRYWFWIMIASLVGAVTLPVMSEDQHFFTVADAIAIVPKCDSDTAARDVKAVFNDIPFFKAAGVKALYVDHIREVAASENDRTCRGTVLTSANEHQDIQFGFEKRNGEVYVSVNAL